MQYDVFACKLSAFHSKTCHWRGLNKKRLVEKTERDKWETCIYMRLIAFWPHGQDSVCTPSSQVIHGTCENPGRNRWTRLARWVSDQNHKKTGAQCQTLELNWRPNCKTSVNPGTNNCSFAGISWTDPSWLLCFWAVACYQCGTQSLVQLPVELCQGYCVLGTVEAERYGASNRWSVTST